MRTYAGRWSWVGALLLGLLTGATPAAETPAATRPVEKERQGYRLIPDGTWIVSQARVISSATGVPSNVKRKTTVSTDPETGRRQLTEARWTGVDYEPAGPAQPLAPVDPRSFDELGLTPQQTLSDQSVLVGRKRYPCTVAQYVIRNDADGRSVALTLYRDKTATLKLPPRSLSVAGREIPLPADALQAEFTIDGPKVTAKGTRRILSLSTLLTINGKPCACLVESTRTEGTSHDKPMSVQATEWYTEALPGERVRSQTSTSIGSTRVESEVTVVEFGK